VLFLASPILYPTSQIPPALDFRGTVNPVAVAAEAMRRSTLAGEWPSFPLLSLHLVVGAGLLVASIAYLRSIEHRIVDVV
jgi:ABC-type polysaccharide/polyol phosphate export permease